MSRMSVTVDDELVNQAQEALGVGTRSEAIRLALQEAVRRRRLAEALKHRGTITLEMDQAELTRLRAEG